MINNEFALTNNKETFSLNSSSTQNAAVAIEIDHKAISEFLEFLEKNKGSLKSGMGAFHTDNHSNW